jgi:hypothetical protein
MATSETPATGVRAGRAVHPVYSALVGLASLGVLLQGVWAGLFLRPRAAGGQTWVAVHQHGGEVTALLALLATVAALVWLRDRVAVLAGTVAFLVLLAVELVLGYTIEDSPGLVAVHVPLAMVIMGLAVWLPLAARRR